MALPGIEMQGQNCHYGGIALVQLTCQTCKRPLAYPGKGRPPLRHPECQAEHRREYVRNAVRNLRKRERGDDDTD